MLFLVVVFLLKTTSIFQNTETYQRINGGNGLTYNSDLTIKDLVSKDTDSDGIADWEEGLWGTDPTKKETTPGIPDSTAVSKLKAQQGSSGKTTNGSAYVQNTENLTETEKFSRELFTTIAAANQNGVMDQASVEALSASLAQKIQNPVVRKVFSISDIKIVKDDSAQAVQNYFNTMNSIQAKYPIKENVTDVLQKFIIDENNVDTSVLVKLDPAINQTQKIINGILTVSVPQSLVSLHLDLLNAGERGLENVSDMRLFDTDPIVAMGAIIKYGDNQSSFQSAFIALATAISKKLNN